MDRTAKKMAHLSSNSTEMPAIVIDSNGMTDDIFLC